MGRGHLQVNASGATQDGRRASYHFGHTLPFIVGRMPRPWTPQVIPGGVGAPRRRRLIAPLKSLLLGGGFAGLALAFWPGPPDATAGPVARPGLVRVIDGDTFDYAGERIRIAGIDTPELNARCGREADLAVRAAARARAWLAAGPFELRADADRDVDRYGRKLRSVVRGGSSIDDVLVSEGLARRWTGHRRPWCV